MKAWFEGEQVGVERLRGDSELVHPLQPCRSFEGSRVGVRDRRRMSWRVLVPAGGCPVGDRGQSQAADEPAVAANPFVHHDPWAEVTPLFLRQPRSPQVRRLGDVAVRVDDGGGFEGPACGCCHRSGHGTRLSITIDLSTIL